MIDKKIALLKKRLDQEQSTGKRYILLKKIADLMFSEYLFSEAADYYEQAYLCRVADTPMQIIELHFRYGTSLYHIGMYDKAVEILRYNLSHVTSKKARHYLTSTYYTLASLYSQLHDYTTAIEYAQKALEINALTNDIRQKARICNVFNIIYNSMEDYESALSWLFKGLDLVKGHNFTRTEAMFYNNIGHLNMKMGKYEEAIDYFMRAMEAKVGDATSYSLAVSLYNIGFVCAQLRQFKEAEDYYEKALHHALISADMLILEQIYRDFSSLCEIKNDFTRAYDYYKKYTEVRHEIYNNERTRKLADMQNQFEIDKKKREAEIYRLESIELADAQKKLLQQNKELMRINHSKDHILNLVSHDLKNSIGTISSILTLIPSQSDPLFNSLMQMIADSAVKSLDLVESIVSSSKIEMDSFNLTLQPVFMRRFFEEHLSLLKLMTDKKHQQLSIQIPDSDIPCALDPQSFWEIISNVVSNAVKFTSEQGRIVIRGREKNGMFYVSVKDNGIGIPKIFKNSVFDKFTAARRAGTNGEATTGLGLSIVKRLTELHRGTIRLRSKEGEGTTVTISIPFYPRKEI